jgi:hypothetical protein
MWKMIYHHGRHENGRGVTLEHRIGRDGAGGKGAATELIWFLTTVADGT